MGEIERREDIQSLAVAIRDDGFICGVRLNGVPERYPISPEIVEVGFVPAEQLRQAEDENRELRAALERYRERTP